jgi:hypothetical protein
METLQLGHEVGQRDAAPIFGTQLCTIRFHQGRAGELIELAQAVMESVPDLPTTRVLLALANAESGDLEAARTALEPLARAGFDRMAPDLTRLAALTGSAWVAAMVGEREWSASLERILRPHLGLGVVAGPLCWGAVDHFVGMLCTTLGRFDEADAAFTSAAVLHERLGSPPLLARSQIEWARTLAARDGPGDAARGGALRHDALSTAGRLGLGSIERRALA